MSESTACNYDTCSTCSDRAVAARVLQLLGDGTAVVDIGGRTEEISIELTDAAVGEIVLVHAKVAIAKLLESR